MDPDQKTQHVVIQEIANTRCWAILLAVMRGDLCLGHRARVRAMFGFPSKDRKEVAPLATGLFPPAILALGFCYLTGQSTVVSGAWRDKGRHREFGDDANPKSSFD
jgi:hypothetical protein